MGVCREGYFPVVQLGKQQCSFTGFGKMTIGGQYRIVIIDGSEAVVEEPVGVFGEGDAVGRIIVAAFGKLVDVAGVDDGAGGKGNQSIAGQDEGIL